jgi:RHS repeat-associated protein
MEYPVISPPVGGKPFSKMSREEAKTYFKWYLSQIPIRIRILERAVRTSGDKYTKWEADMSPVSLILLGEWFADNIEIVPPSANTDTYPSYTAFGETLSHSGASDNPYLYTGQQFDALTGLYSLRARYYDPALGRFLSRDPAEPLLTAPHELNRYVYVADNPLNAADPSGRFAAVEYSMANRESEEESAALEPVGEETASELQALGRTMARIWRYITDSDHY